MGKDAPVAAIVAARTSQGSRPLPATLASSGVSASSPHQPLKPGRCAIPSRTAVAAAAGTTHASGRGRTEEPGAPGPDAAERMRAQGYAAAHRIADQDEAHAGA